MNKNWVYYIFIFLLMSLYSSAQVVIPEDSTQINQIDSKNNKQGFWIYRQEAMMGEASLTKFGYYLNNKKEGTWYELDFLGNLKSIENYTKNVLNGTCSYFENGNMVLQGNFRGLNPDYKFDTIVVINPVNLEEVTRIFPTEMQSLRHGTWKYFNPETGAKIKEEDYQVGDLIAKRDYYTNMKMDSMAMKKLESTMPHITDPSGARGAKGHRKSLIE